VETFRFETNHPGRDARATRVLAVGCGDLHTEMLAAAGYQVEREAWIEFSRLEQADLLVLAPSPPEPPAHDLVRQLCRRSATPVIALIEQETDSEHAAVLAAGAADCLDAATSGDEILAHVEALLARSPKRAPPFDAASPTSRGPTGPGYAVPGTGPRR
jgi:DNA-binding response OmpR family regulator